MADAISDILSAVPGADPMADILSATPDAKPQQPFSLNTSNIEAERATGEFRNPTLNVSAIDQKRKSGFLPYQPDKPIQQQGPGWRDVEIGAQQGVQAAALPYAKAAQKLYGGHLPEMMEAQGPSPEELASRQSFGSKVLQGAARAPFDIARYATVPGGPASSMAMADILAATSEAESPEEAGKAGVQAGVKGAAMGGALEGLSPYGRATRIPAAAAIGGGMTALEGGGPSDIAASAVTMGGLSGIHGARPEGLSAPGPVDRETPPQPTAAPQPELPAPAPIQPQTIPVKRTRARTPKPGPADQLLANVPPMEPNPNVTAAQPTVPESPGTLQLQVMQLQKGQRRAVMFPKGTGVPQLPDGTATHQDAFGNTYAYNPDAITPQLIDSAVATNRLSSILGDATAGMGAPDKADLQGPVAAVVGRTMDGTTVQSTATDAANLQATIDATKKVTPPGGTVSVEPAENEIANRVAQGAPPPTEPLQGGPGDASGEYFRGAWNIDLNQDGRDEAALLGQNTAGQFTEINAGTLNRHQETARAIAATNPQAGPVKTTDALDPWTLGNHEGNEVTPERVADINDRVLNRPDEDIPGAGKYSGKPGESFNDFKNPLVQHFRDQVARWKPGEKILNVTSGRDAQAIRAYVAAGMPEDLSVDPAVMTAKWQTEPGEMMRFDPRTGQITDVANANEDGVFVARHGETDANENGAVPPPPPSQQVTPFDTPEVIAARQRAATMPHTIDTLPPDKLQERSQRIQRLLYKTEGVDRNKQAYLVIGPPASGKSTISEPLARETGSLIIDSDQAKEKLPEYAGGLGAEAVHRESSDIAFSLMDRAADEGLNIVHPIVGWQIDKVRKIQQSLGEQGYDVHLVHVDVPAEEAARRAVDRFRRTNRFVDPSYVLKTADATKRNYDTLKSEGGFKSYAQFANDVPEGQSPRLTDSQDFTALRSFGSVPAGGAGGHPALDQAAGTSEAGPEVDAARETGGSDPGFLASESGTGKDILGLTPTYERRIVPFARSVAAAWDGLKRVFAPGSRGSAAESAQGSLRENLAHMTRLVQKTDGALERSRRTLDALTTAQKYNFIRRVESNQPQASPSLDTIAGVMRDVNEMLRTEVDDSDPNVQRAWREVYFPNLWEEKAQGTGMPGQRGNLKGSAGFTKEKVFGTFDEGLAAGYTPKFDNPIDFWKAKSREMAKFAMATKLKQDLKPMAVKLPFGQRVPEGWGKINDPMGRIFQYSDTEKGMIYRGDWIYPKPAADLINNHLSPSLRQTVPLFNDLANLGNMWLRWKLTGFYHFATTGLNAMYSHAALGMRYALDGDFAEAAKQAVQATPFAAVTDAIRGRTMRERFLDMGGQQTDVYKALEAGGFRSGQDPWYSTNFRQRFVESIKAGETIGAIPEGIGALSETITAPILEKYVPWMKQAAIEDLARYELKKLGPNYTREQLRSVMAKAVDSVDNRFGQLPYDNLFWNRIAKDLLMVSVMSLGWNLGTVRELGGGAKDALESLKALAGRQGPGFTNRIAYLLALNTMHAGAAALYQYLRTGKGPQSIKDLAFPQNGEVDERGRPARSQFADYVRDEWGWANQPGTTLANKLHPFPSELYRVLGSNKSYWGNQIRTPGAPWLDQLKEIGSYIGKEEALPLSGTNFLKARQQGTGLGQSMLQQVGGINPAPTYINRTAAESLADEYAAQHREQGGKPAGRASHAQARAQIMRAMQTGENPNQAIADALKSGAIQVSDIPKMRKQARLTPLQRQIPSMTVREALNVYSAATPDERQQIAKQVRVKLAGARAKPYEWQDATGNTDPTMVARAKQYFGINPIRRPELSAPGPVQ